MNKNTIFDELLPWGVLSIALVGGLAIIIIGKSRDAYLIGGGIVSNGISGICGYLKKENNIQSKNTKEISIDES
ncbi:MAG: hypothetical protein F6J92_32795 [Symploca sp. SIO1A3]|nr:hypothetical protein [Symploca sp. SIO1A3]